MWDLTLPPGSEAISNGDNRIRELKTDIQTSLQTYGSFPGSDPANPKYIWTISRGNTASRPASPVSGQMYNNTQTFSLERYNGATWDNVNALPAAATVDETMLAASVAGNGLAGGAGTVLSVNVDGSTIEINADTLRVKDLGISTAKIAASAVDENKLNVSVAGNGLAGGGGAALSVNVDNSTIEINSDSLRVKDGGITQAKLATAVVNQLGQNIGIVARASHTTTSTSLVDALNISTQGRLMGVIHNSNNSPQSTQYTVTVDGVQLIDSGSVAAGNHHPIYNAANSTTICSNSATQGNGAELMAYFRTSLQIQHRCTPAAVTNSTTYIQYERAA